MLGGELQGQSEHPQLCACAHWLWSPCCACGGRAEGSQAPERRKRGLQARPPPSYQGMFAPLLSTVEVLLLLMITVSIIKVRELRMACIRHSPGFRCS